ncbi:MAG: tRNA (adenosine(37)-N6)-dimethylallyltransferase MiaA [Alphaproteobacteria bacterium]|nr:tRNA (adenosine(37)-N6)-dimethylallyltransferase MiaA [Alphaproteobacteria bacterium]
MLIAGPTASGKSALGLELAEALQPFGGAEIINADSMQVYRELRVLTARPTVEDEARVPHRLYGTVPGAEASSAMAWRDRATAAIAESWQHGRVPIVVGGTGLYFRALLEGLAPVPTISPAIRELGRRRLAELGSPAFHAELARRDPEMAARVRPSDRQRSARAWEVIEQTGVSLAEWQRRPAVARLQGEILGYVLAPDRQALASRIDRRFARMVDDGAMDEVAALLDQALLPGLPIMRALGVRELAALVPGTCTRAAAIAAGQQATRHYAKRQATWFRNQMSNWVLLEQESESFLNKIFPKIRQLLLTRDE